MKLFLKYGGTHALATGAYVICVALFLSRAEQFFGQEKTLFIPIAMLLLLIFSVALVGSLIFGRPILWYLDGKKKEAVALLACTLAILFVLVVLAFVALALFGAPRTP
jgi:hypothetical protein